MCPVKRPRKRASDHRAGQRVARRWSGRNDQVAIDDLTHDVLWKAKDVLVGGGVGLLRRKGHDRKLTRQAGRMKPLLLRCTRRASRRRYRKRQRKRSEERRVGKEC